MKLKRHVFLMYCGFGPGKKEYRKWNTVEVEPVLVYRNAESTDSFFPAVLFLALISGKGRSLIPGFGAPGNKEDWLAWIDDVLLPGHNLEAVARTVENHKLPPVDVWVSLPYPDKAQKDFGHIAERHLDFKRNDDRILSLKWWINRFLAAWHAKIKAGGLHRYISLKGFYWPAERMTLKDRLLLPDLISYIRSIGFKTLWIPYYAASHFLNITNPGFDITVIQPNYLQKPALGWDRLKKTAQKADKYRTGIEIELDTAAVDKNSPQYRVVLDYLNRGLPEFEGYMTCPFLAYYTGYKTILQLYNNKSPLYTYLYRFVKGTLKKVNYLGIPY